MSYKGRFSPVNKEKYVGDINQIIYRSLWERQAFKWLDTNSKVVKWGSEIIVIPYLCEVDKKQHRYFVDLYIKMESGEQFIIEIKPEKQTRAPKTPQRKTRRFINESLTYIKNQSKWKAAASFAESHGMKFFIWTENELKALGIKIVSDRIRKKKTDGRKKEINA